MTVLFESCRRCFCLFLVVVGFLFPIVAASSSSRDSIHLDDNASSDHDLIPAIITNNGSKLAATAASHATDRLASLRKRYEEAGCHVNWGPFPEVSNLSDVSKRKTAAEVRAGGGHKICQCGLLHDLAVAKVRLLSTLQLPDENNANDSTTTAAAEGHNHEDFFGIGPAEQSSTIASNTGTATTPSSTPATVTPLTAWAMANTAITQTTKCVEGAAAGYPCRNIDLVAHLPLSSFRATGVTNRSPELGNDVWGWTHTTTSGEEREFLVWGINEGHMFFEVFIDRAPDLLGYLPSAEKGTSLWHDAKIIGDWVYMGAEIEWHGIQVFDLKRLLTLIPCSNLKSCRVLEEDKWYWGQQYNYIGYSHNIVANNDHGHLEDNPQNRRQYVYMVGGDDCDEGLHVVDVTNPRDPRFAGCYEDSGYVHDAQCVDYHGPDTSFNNQYREICILFADDSVDIVDVTNKNNMKLITVIQYRETGFTHQGWLSPDHRFVVFGDEWDEPGSRSDKTRTLVVNISELRNPGPVKEFYGTTQATDHNQYIASISRSTGLVENVRKSYVEGGATNETHIDIIYQSNYQAGLGLLHVLDYETTNFREVAYFDPYPEKNGPDTDGAWSVFPFYKSGLVAIGTIEEGLFLVKPDLRTSMPRQFVDPTDQPTSLPTSSPTLTPTEAPTIYIDCTDGDLAYNNNTNKNCTWVGSGRVKKINRNRCAKVWEGVEVADTCRETCGRMGLGICGDRKFKRKRNGRNKKKQTKKNNGKMMRRKRNNVAAANNHNSNNSEEVAARRMRKLMVVRSRDGRKVGARPKPSTWNHR